MGWYILGVIIALVISAIIAACFADVAREKGFEESHYFWLCFIFGIAGYLLVVALPDRKIRTTPFKPEMKTASANPVSPKPMPKQNVPNGQKACWACGHVQPKSNECCSNCGEVL